MVSTRPIDLLMGLSLVLHKRSWYSTEESEKLIWLVTNSNTETPIFNCVSLKLARGREGLFFISNFDGEGARFLNLSLSIDTGGRQHRTRYRVFTALLLLLQSNC